MAAIDASVSPSAIPASVSAGQWALRITRASATSTIIRTAPARTRRRASGVNAAARKNRAPKNAAAAVAWPLGNPIESSSGRGRPIRILSSPSAMGAATISPPQTHQRRRPRGNATNSRSDAGRSTFQLPASLITFSVRTIGGVAIPSSHSRTVVSPGTDGKTITASVRTRNPAAPASMTQNRLLRRRELSATAATIVDEPQDAPAGLRVERDAADAVGALVPRRSEARHDDHAGELLVRRLEEEHAAIGAVVLDRQEGRRVPRRARHPAAPRSRDGGGGVDGPRGRQARASGDQRGQHENGASRSPGHADGVRRPDAGRTAWKAAQSTISVNPNAHTTVAPVGRSKTADAVIPITLTSVPKAQPMTSLCVTVRPRRMPASAGTIRYEKTSRTPAIRTELVTTTPKDA